ncbi:MAG: dNTP triphosphohydrolase [Acidobacteria bacterium]|nr:dNTP triphosphohydrolase [Acidobacteriota bacterium]
MTKSLRFAPEVSRGRRFDEPPHPYRNCFQRDRDRIVHSRAFRRLENKTQVFTTPLSDHFRNRLTHTIEVAQIARTVAGALGLETELVEALSLAHDVGHPPFGHAGEHVLDEQMQRFGERFDHNLHALRVVERFEQRYAAFAGLNLTFEVREGLIKHSRDYSAAHHPELAEYRLDELPPLEAQLIDPADEIAYNCADLDDAFEARLLEPEEIRGEIEAFDQGYRAAERLYPQANRFQLFNEALRRLTDYLATALIEGVREAVQEAGVETIEQVRTAPVRLARLTPEASAASKALKAFLSRRVYRSAAIERDSLEARGKIEAVFEYYLRLPEKMPRFYRERIQTEPAHRVACDYIAGMTDKYLLRRYAELYP